MTFFLLLLAASLPSQAGVRPFGCTEIVARATSEVVPLVESVEREISDSGGSHSGVFEVRTDRGRMALKVRNTPMKIKREALDVQRELALRGFSPRIFAVVEGDALAALRPALKAKQRKTFPPSMENDQGIFMDLILDGWNCPSSEHPMPAAAAGWNKEAILTRMTEMENALAEMNVLVMNPQVLIDGAGVAHLIDIEMVARGTLQKPLGTSLHGPRTAFIEAWHARFKK